MTNKKCNSCGGNLIFSPTSCSLYCEKCKTLQPINANRNFSKRDYESFISSNKTLTKSAVNENEFNCPTCGASISLKGLEFAGTCPYCGSNIVNNNEKDNLTIDAIVPFKIDRDKVYENYRSSVKKKHFIPSVFKKQPPMDNVKGYYIPSFGFDAKTSSVYQGVLENEYRDGNGNTHVDRKRISGHQDIDFTDVLIESSSKINQLDLDSILPFNVKEAYLYDDDFIRGYSVEKFNDKLENCYRLAKREMEEMIRDQILSKYTYTRVVSFNCDTKIANKKFCYYMLPIYSIDFEYKGKNYKTTMNGQTGKVGTGIPKSKVKIAFTAISVILFISLIILLVVMFGN